MVLDPRKARDIALLDAVDAFRRESFARSVWRVARDGRDPLLGSASRSRWCNDSFDVLYTSTERDGALAEIYALLSSQPVFPSKIEARVHRIAVRASSLLVIPDLAALERLGVNIARYRERDYGRTQEIADAAYFLGFDGLVAPSGRWNCHSVVLFTDRVAPTNLRVEETEADTVDWNEWKSTRDATRG